MEKHSLMLTQFETSAASSVNAFIEAFNGCFRVECLNAHWFSSLQDAREKMGDWRKYCSEVRPIDATNQKAPVVLPNAERISSQPLLSEAQSISPPAI